MMRFQRILLWTAAIRISHMESVSLSRRARQTRYGKAVFVKSVVPGWNTVFTTIVSWGITSVHPVALQDRKSNYDAHDVKVGDQLSFQVEDKHLTANYKGFYNVYNILAAYAGLRTAGFSGEHFQNMLQKFNPENGRMEQFRIKGTGVMLNLAKNPAGFNQNISAVMQDKTPKDIIITINDNAQDGTDISWLWDVDFDLLGDASIHSITVSGIRCQDMRLRMKYVDIPVYA